MTAVHAAMNLNGPFAEIAKVIQNGATTIPTIRRAMIAPRRRALVKNLKTMVQIGLLTEIDLQFALTPKCIHQMPSHPRQSPLS